MTLEQEVPTKTYKDAGSFICASGLLKQALGRLLPFVGRNPIVPILENAHFQIDQASEMTIRTSDLQQTASAKLCVEGGNSTRFVAPIGDLVKLLSTIEDQPISISYDDTWKVTINTDFGSYELAGENPIDFPKPPEFTPNSTFTIPVADLRDLCRTLHPFTSTDDLRPAMTGVCWESGYSADVLQNVCELASTDGHRLIRLQNDAALSANPFKVIIPRGTIGHLKTILPKKGDDVTVEIGSANIRFSWGSMSVVSRLIDERFPDYNNAIPTGQSIITVVSRIALMNAIKRSLIFASRVTSQISFQTGASFLRVASENLDYSSKSNERIEATSQGDSLRIGVNGRLMLETLSVIESPMVEMRMSAANRAFILHPWEALRGADETKTLLIMPVMLSTY